jgi:aminoglycoside 6'-N-acetyltransferase
MPDMFLRHATPADIPMLRRWDEEPHVISATSDDPDDLLDPEPQDWDEELALHDPGIWEYWIAEADGRPVGVMQMCDPHLEPTRYWGDIEPNLRALDIWIGDPADLGKGYGEQMMRLAFERCFAEPAVTAILIDPLFSNTRAQRFYQRLGFKVLERRLFHGEDDCLVHRLTRSDWEAAR